MTPETVQSHNEQVYSCVTQQISNSYLLSEPRLISCMLHHYLYVKGGQCVSACCIPQSFLFSFWRDSHQWVMASSFPRLLDHTQRRTTVGRTPLDEWSARRREHTAKYSTKFCYPRNFVLHLNFLTHLILVRICPIQTLN